MTDYNFIIAENLENASRRDAEIKRIYKDYRPVITSLGQKFGYSRTDSEDVLQDAIVVLWRKLNNDEFQFNSKLTTFIYSVAKRMFINKSHRDKKFEIVDLSDLEVDIGEEEQIDETLFETRQSLIIATLDKIGKKCKSLITDFYLGMSMTELAEKHKYSSTANATNQRYRCMQRLKRKITD